MAMSAAATNRIYDVDAIDEALQRSESTFRSPRMVDADDTDAVEGVVRWKADKSIWISTMTLWVSWAGRSTSAGVRSRFSS